MGRLVASEAPLQLANEEEVEEMAVQAPRTPSRGSLTRSAGAAFGRGLLLALLALAIGVLLLAYALDDGNPSEVATVGSSGTSAATGAASTQNPGSTGASPVTSATTQAPVTAVTHEASTVSVLLLNANGIGGIAAANKEQLLPKGFNATTADAPARVEQSVVYYLDVAYLPDAAVVAKTLNVPDAQVLPLADPATAGLTPGDAKVVVILGTDGKHFRPA